MTATTRLSTVPVFAFASMLAFVGGGCESCKGGKAPTAVGGTSVDVAIEGAGRAQLKYGRAATFGDGIEVFFTPQPLACGAPVTQGSTYVRFAVGAGPGGRFFSGHPMGVEITAAIGATRTTAASFHSSLMLEPFELKEGARLKGNLSFQGRGKPKAAGHGGFEIEICRTVPLPEGAAQPDSVSGPVRGHWGDRGFSSGSAIVELAEPNDGPRYLDSIYFFEEKGVTCGTRGDHVQNALRIYEMPTADVDASWKEPQPASARWVFLDQGAPREHVFEGRLHPAWVRFDALEHRRGTTAKGALYVDSLQLPGTTITPAKIEGTFEAFVCPWANDDEPTAGSTVELVAKDGKAPATHARVRPLVKGLELVISTEESRCKAADDQKDDLGVAVVVRISEPKSGPASVVSARAMAQGKEPRDVTSLTEVTLDPFEWRELAHVRGRIVVRDALLSASGSFDAPICLDRFGSTASGK